jgi:hypothetical protein
MDFEFTPVDSIDKVPEQFRGIYKQGDDGKFVPDDAHKGVIEAITGLNRSLKAARAEAKAKTPVDLSPLADFGKTPEEIKAAVESRINELQEQVAKGGDAKVNLEKIKQDLAAAHAKDLERANKRSEALQNQLYGLLVENAATAAVVELKGVPELLLPFIKQQVKVVEEEGQFNVYVVDSSGDRRYSGVTGQPMTIKELVAEMKANEKYGRLFESEAPAGGGMPPRGGSTPPRQPGRVLSANEKIAVGLAKGQFKSGRGR